MVTAKLNYRVRGRTCEELLLLKFVTIRQPAIHFQVRQFAPGATNHGVIANFFLEGFALRAPKGELEQHKPLLTTMMASTRQNPGWVAAIAQHRRKMQRMRLKGMWNRHQIRMRTHREIAAMQKWGWEKQQASRDAQAATFSRTMREVELFDDPVLGRNIELSAGYKFVYRNNKGEYLLFNDPLLDPNMQFEGDWQKLRRAE